MTQPIRIFLIILIISIAGLVPTRLQADPATLRIVELDHRDRGITGSLHREDNENENIPIKRGFALLPDGWKPGEMLVIIISSNPERYGNPHYKPCPLPKSNLIQIPTRAWAAAFVDFRDHN